MGLNLKSLFSVGASQLVDSVGKAVDGLITSKEEAQTLKIELQKVINDHEVAMEVEYTKQQDIVNQTMREEAKSEKFLQWSWRPLIGYLFIAMCFNNYIILPYLGSQGLKPIELPGEMITTIMVILGVASAGRSFKMSKK